MRYNRLIPALAVVIACAGSTCLVHAQTKPQRAAGWFVALIKKDKPGIDKELGASKKTYGTNTYKIEGFDSLALMYDITKNPKGVPFVSTLVYSANNLNWKDALKQAGIDATNLTAKKVSNSGIVSLKISGIKGLKSDWEVDFTPEFADPATHAKHSALTIGEAGKD